ncbi:caffeine-induced death protein 2-domain-containing protein [Crepidotus variabilis]|uniref:Caffeine-induced death protein 2-domain-containing protein n=1 Tax=Crepidotus variabilis TaxID=179855 RepID=A0A9P6EQQ8_9AGAR|nr:caffeine-induced death protein 2-domain-containing protein [Crepidotus variabilis]
MPMKQLGSLAVHAPSLTPQTIQITPSTCHDLSLFKDILKEYRKLDDTIVMRLNRANARMRDQDRVQTLNENQTLQDQACDHIWRELVANWKRRTQLVGYCVDVMDQSLIEKRSHLDEGTQSPAARRKTQGEIYEEEVKHRLIRNESTVEDIVRNRSIAAFNARCQYFVPPRTDAEARKMWDSALR